MLMIGAHPDDEDTFLITWLQRGRHVETAYLSLTRGDGGQNIIGNELGEALGVIRTEELLAARRIDGAQQFFTRAFDFGFSKDTIDTFRHWQRDSILRDVIRVVREFRPHVIIAVFSGTPQDGHGHHQVSGLLARAAYELAGDTMSVPTPGTRAWTPLKFYRVARFNSQAGTLGMDVGEYSPLLGRSFGEIAGESRSQHKSQGFGAAQRKGPIMDYVRREASRVNAASPTGSEKSLFDGIDTTWARLRSGYKWPRALASLDSLPGAIARLQNAYDARFPERVLAPAAEVSRHLFFLRSCPTEWQPCYHYTEIGGDIIASAVRAELRLTQLQVLASGIAIEAVVSTPSAAEQTGLPAIITLYNRGSVPLLTSQPIAFGSDEWSVMTRKLAPGAVRVDTLRPTVLSVVSEPVWLRKERVGDMFEPAIPDMSFGNGVSYQIMYGTDSAWFMLRAPLMYRSVDQVRGEQWRELAVVRPVNLSLGAQTMYVPANSPVDRVVSVNVWSEDTTTRDVVVTLDVPAGLRTDSSTRTIRLGGRDNRKAVDFRLRGQLRPGERRLSAFARSGGKEYGFGYELIDYDHIRPQRIRRPASARLVAVDVRIPAKLRVAYIRGMGDNVAPTLTQLGVPTTVISAADVARTDLSAYSTVLIGPRAYEAYPELLAANPKLFDFARKGGVLMVQYGQYEMTQPGAMPFPITINRPHDRVTLEDAPVTIDAPGARELTFPNRITAADFDGWVQERGLYMPRTFDPAYRSLISTNDPNEPANRGGVLVAPLGDGLYIYTSLSFFRQLPAGVPGAARLFVNLMSAKLAPPSPTP